MTHGPDIPEAVRDYFGHDKVALFGSGGMPAAPPAPPGSPARRQGEAALADALSKAGTPGRRPGDQPVVRPPRPKLNRAMRQRGERALMEASMRSVGGRYGASHPHGAAGWFWASVFAPGYRRIPWSVKRRLSGLTSGVKGWRKD
jgi:hypothetical protein